MYRQELTRVKAYHLLSPREGIDYREQLEGMTSYYQWLREETTAAVPLTLKEEKGTNWAKKSKKSSTVARGVACKGQVFGLFDTLHSWFLKLVHYAVPFPCNCMKWLVLHTSFVVYLQFKHILNCLIPTLTHAHLIHDRGKLNSLLTTI